MTRVRLGLVLVMLAVAPGLSSAATIGLLSGNSDPTLITDPADVPLTEADCAFAVITLPEDYRCALYDASTFSGIFRLDVHLDDGHDAPIPFPDSVTVDVRSVLQFLSASTIFHDGFTFSLSGTTLPCVTCVFFSSHGNGLFDPASVSVVGVNGIVNRGALPVPEPATLLLLVSGGMAAWRRRLLRDGRG